MVNTFSLQKKKKHIPVKYIYILNSLWLETYLNQLATDQTRPAFIQCWNCMLKTEVLLLGQKQVAVKAVPCRSTKPLPGWVFPISCVVSTCKPLLLRKGLPGTLGSIQGSRVVPQERKKLQMIKQPCTEADGFHKGAYKQERSWRRELCRCPKVQFTVTFPVTYLENPVCMYVCVYMLVVFIPTFLPTSFPTSQ